MVMSVFNQFFRRGLKDKEYFHYIPVGDMLECMAHIMLSSSNFWCDEDDNDGDDQQLVNNDNDYAFMTETYQGVLRDGFVALLNYFGREGMCLLLHPTSFFVALPPPMYSSLSHSHFSQYSIRLMVPIALLTIILRYFPPDATLPQMDFLRYVISWQ